MAPRTLLLAQVPRVGPVYRSRERVYGTDPATGHTVLLYGIGTEIPLAEAVRQGVVTVDQLTDEQRRQLAAHGLLPQPEEQEREGHAARKSPQRPPRDKMIREGGTRTKGV
jgi:hypothetical protein